MQDLDCANCAAKMETSIKKININKNVFKIVQNSLNMYLKVVTYKPWRRDKKKDLG